MNDITSVCTYVFCYNEIGELCTLVGRRTSSAPTGANMFTPPMGMVEYRENPYDAAVRECFEETNILIPKNELKYYDTETYFMRGKQCFGANFYIILKGTTNKHTIGIGDGENDKFIWLPLSKIDSITWAFGTNNKIKEIISNFKENIVELSFNDLKDIINESIKCILKKNK